MEEVKPGTSDAGGGHHGSIQITLALEFPNLFAKPMAIRVRHTYKDERLWDRMTCSGGIYLLYRYQESNFQTLETTVLFPDFAIAITPLTSVNKSDQSGIPNLIISALSLLQLCKYDREIGCSQNLEQSLSQRGCAKDAL